MKIGATISKRPHALDTSDTSFEPRCPSCSGTLIPVGTCEIGLGAMDLRARQAYWCPAGCRGPESDGTFEFFACPACGSADTLTLPHTDGVEELECRVCGMITTLQITPQTGRPV